VPEEITALLYDRRRRGIGDLGDREGLRAFGEGTRERALGEAGVPAVEMGEVVEKTAPLIQVLPS
jgi:hypothetical protein